MDCGPNPEATVPVDLLASEGTLVSEQGCKESWIYPPLPFGVEAGSNLGAVDGICRRFLFARGLADSLPPQKTLMSFGVETGSPQCEAFVYLLAILEQIERSKSPSHWAWMLQR